MMRALILVTLLMLCGCDIASSSAAKPFKSPYIATAVGRVDARADARNLVASVDGVIETLAVKVGDAVTANQRLMQIHAGCVMR